jgi:N utilization substance protein B
MEQILRRHSSNPAFEFAKTLVEGIARHREEIDGRLAVEAPEWDLGRMPPIDRSLMRLAVFEMLYLEEVPAAVSINEAVELAKIYSTEESGGFINGVLGSFLSKLRS